MDLDWLRVAYGQLQKDRAPGYDGETVQEYGNDLDSRLTDLLARVKGGSYYAPPVKRVHIPKGNGKETRPIGIPTTEDKVLQRAVAMLLEPIYGAVPGLLLRISARALGPSGVTTYLETEHE
jgi:RNA-directed DNA polymerase